MILSPVPLSVLDTGPWTRLPQMFHYIYIYIFCYALPIIILILQITIRTIIIIIIVRKLLFASQEPMYL